MGLACLYRKGSVSTQKDESHVTILIEEREGERNRGGVNDLCLILLENTWRG